MSILFRNEDLTTEKLAELLRSSPTALEIFLQFLCGDDVQAKRFAKLRLVVEAQHRFSVGRSGRFDLLIHDGSLGIIVECKTMDRPKVFQLEKYYKYWMGKYGQKPLIFWLVRKKAGPMGINPYLAREMLWDQLHSHLSAAATIQRSTSTRQKIENFCEYLEDSQILLQPNERATYIPKGRGYDYQFAERLLDEVGASFSDSVYEVVAPMNKVTHRLFIGRNAWKKKFEDGWIERVTLQFMADKLTGRFHWHSGIMLYNRHNIVDPTFAIHQLPHWAPICKKSGLRLLRNPGSKWCGESYEIEPPYHIARPVKYFHAPLPASTWPRPSFGAEDESQMVAEGKRIVKFLCGVVDKF